MKYQKAILIGMIVDRGCRMDYFGDGVHHTVFGLDVGDGRGGMMAFVVVVPGRYGETMLKYLEEGRHLMVEGRIHIQRGCYVIWASYLGLGMKLPMLEKRK